MTGKNQLIQTQLCEEVIGILPKKAVRAINQCLEDVALDSDLSLEQIERLRGEIVEVVERVSSENYFKSRYGQVSTRKLGESLGYDETIFREQGKYELAKQIEYLGDLLVAASGRRKSR